jgi:ubiquitin-conjugating enzyme E2 G1
MAMKRLGMEMKEIINDCNYLYSIYPREDNFLEWSGFIIGPEDTYYEGGIFPVEIKFTIEYPNRPPQVIVKNIIHPNIYNDGKVCISILHEGSDQFGYEKDIERWLPTHGINTIMLSIISILSAPNFESPANIDASVLWKNKPHEYKIRIYELIKLSQK